VLEELQRGCDAGEDNWMVAIDSTVVRAHHHAAGARHQPPCDVPSNVLAVALAQELAAVVAAERDVVEVPEAVMGAGSNDTNSQLSQRKHGDREALGRCRGGLSTKIHLLADSRCRPLRTITTAGQRHNSLAFELLMDDLRVGRHGPGRPRTRPDALLADKAYSNKAIRGHLRARGIKAVIPLKADQQAGRRRRGTRGRLPAFDAQVYRERNVVERAVNKLRGTPRGGHQVRQARLRLPRHH